MFVLFACFIDTYNHVRGVFGKYVDKFNKMRIKYTSQMKFCKNEYQLFNIKYDQYENLTLTRKLTQSERAPL